MALTARPRWLAPALALAAVGAAVPATVSGLGLAGELRPGNFCNPSATIDAPTALRDASLRRFHERIALPVGACVALCVAFGASAGAALRRRASRWLVAGLAALALGGFLGADFSGKKEAWHTLSPGLSGWSKIPLPPGFAGGGLSVTRPECAPELKAKMARRVATLYWAHLAAGGAMALAAGALGLLGTSWRPEEKVA
ncbi:MAG TPA: hypothetical protein VMB50_22295 [Myxococcales bacterium]|nr:hypothetical protein [Myxococcales bacterium]